MASPYDSYSGVPTGQAGTGEAFILKDDAPSPILLLEKRRQEFDAAKKQKKAEEAANLAAVDKSVGEAWDVDLPTLEPMRDDLTTAYAYQYKTGGDPNDPRNPEYGNVRKVRDGVMSRFGASRAHKVMYDSAQKDLNDHPERYDVEKSKAAWDLWRNLPLEQRMKTPPPTNKKAPFDMAKYTKEFVTRIKDPNQTATYWADNATKQIVEKTEKFFPVDQQALYGQAFLKESPEAQAYVDDKYQALAAGDRQRYEQEATKINTKLAKEGSVHRIRPEDIYATSFFGGVFNRSVDLKTHNMPDEDNSSSDYKGSGYGKDEIDEARRWIEYFGGIVNGSPDIYNPEINTYTADTDPLILQEQGAAAGDQFQVSSTFVNMPMGKYQITDEDGKMQSVDNLITGLKRFKNGKLMIKDTRSQSEKKASNWRPVQNPWTEMMEPIIRGQYGGQAGKILGAIEFLAREEYKMDIKGGKFEADKVFKKPTSTFGATQSKAAPPSTTKQKSKGRAY